MPFIGNTPAQVPLTSADITDGIITSAKIADGTIVNADINASAAIASTKLSGSFGITEADQWRVTASITADVNPISANIERVDTAGQGTIGSAMSVSSGTWTFPSTGIYLVRFVSTYATASGDYLGFKINVTTNNSTYTEIATAFGGHDSVNDLTVILESLIDVTDVANVKVRFSIDSVSAGSSTYGSTTANRTYFTFIRLGDT